MYLVKSCATDNVDACGMIRDYARSYKLHRSSITIPIHASRSACSGVAECRVQERKEKASLAKLVRQSVGISSGSAPMGFFSHSCIKLQVSCDFFTKA
ncbi:hypothetical protein JTE90_027657 [Oedothorax gibbosus]|uniref:Uncharacterized protein n=1 Tax=Oedothorax gibbosus TaxID=931172 RepID=A0AAV6UNE6_9ARAC|nr:hypothetical protein JTE90_027657 [Oedothorax gibbosus]